VDERDDYAVEDGGWVEMTRHTHAQHGVPDDARQMGLDRNTEEGALVAMAGSLSPAKLSHRVVAWAVLASLIGPSLFGVIHHIL
jgi:hypothetical protein